MKRPEADQRSAEAERYRALYKTTRWARLRAATLVRDLYTCQRCKTALIGRHPARNAPVVNHIVAHKGDEALFFDATNLESVCGQCHNSAVQREEKRGSRFGNDSAGRPLAADHPWNAQK